MPLSPNNVFYSATITREILRRHQSEGIRVNSRIKTLGDWSAADPDELFGILEKQAYPLFIGKDFDSSLLVDHLWALHRKERAISLTNFGDLISIQRAVSKACAF